MDRFSHDTLTIYYAGKPLRQCFQWSIPCFLKVERNIILVTSEFWVLCLFFFLIMILKSLEVLVWPSISMFFRSMLSPCILFHPHGQQRTRILYTGRNLYLHSDSIFLNFVHILHSFIASFTWKNSGYLACKRTLSLYCLWTSLIKWILL